MNSAGLRAISINSLCQLQDMGRTGSQRYGVSRAGALDTLLLQLANKLVYNSSDEAAMEIIATACTFEVTASSCLLTVCGDFSLAIDDKPCASFQSHHVMAGSLVEIMPTNLSRIGYLAVAGGFAGADVLGSRSTHLRSGLGTRTAGQSVNFGLRLSCAPKRRTLKLSQPLSPTPSTIRATLGLQADSFKESCIQQFFTTRYSVATQSDRMGYRLEGTTLTGPNDGQLISEATCYGSVQIPPNGQPIVLMADSPTTGGYPKIAQIASCDLRILAQQPEGNTFTFTQVSVEEAQQALRQQNTWLQSDTLLQGCW